ncbi:MAG: hypothetical protein JM58_14220 [Peptococcaceae bacterium BICA1-8]|nr:MAG: hypothetical protein JM58_14220 [Peptococcaceae bacterium BICA1-8]
MYLVAITNWKRKLIYLVAFLLIITLVATIVPQILGFNTVNTDSQINEENLTQPIKVQSTPENEDSQMVNPQK